MFASPNPLGHRVAIKSKALLFFVSPLFALRRLLLFVHPVAFLTRVRGTWTQGIYQRHAPVLLTMARGVWELRESFAPKDVRQKANNRFTDFYDFERVGFARRRRQRSPQRFLFLWGCVCARASLQVPSVWACRTIECCVTHVASFVLVQICGENRVQFKSATALC